MSYRRFQNIERSQVGSLQILATKQKLNTSRVNPNQNQTQTTWQMKTGTQHPHELKIQRNQLAATMNSISFNAQQPKKINWHPKELINRRNHSAATTNSTSSKKITQHPKELNNQRIHSVSKEFTQQPKELGSN